MAEFNIFKEAPTLPKFHEMILCKYASEGRIAAIRIGRVWRFDKDVIDKYIAGGQNNQEFENGSNSEKNQKQNGKKRTDKHGTTVCSQYNL